MNHEWQNISISQDKTFQQLSVSEIKKLAEQYPYSYFHQLLLSLKLKETDEIAYKKQASKTALYANNLPWLEYLLNDHSASANYNPITEQEPVAVIDPSPANEIIQEEESIEAERELYVEHEPAGESDSLVSSILDREKEMAEQETELKFEPLHTVDYFASQGIKNTPEPLPTDKLGKQLRSFTEWLKIMKRLPTEETVQMNETDEKKIQAEAEDSNELKEVITEAMADVLLKQGKNQKAIEIYQKLSLQHPEKSPYFAALIEQLKE